MSPAPAPAPDHVRLDQWLWAARCYKTRSAASAACVAGHVKVDGHTAKPARPLRVGMRVHALTPGGPRILEVLALARRRGPAAAARALYVDHTPPPQPQPEAPAAPRRERGAGRPSKRDRRLLQRLRGR